jgi:hypothetical protein
MFMLGTFLGMLPGLVLMTFFGDRLRDAIQDPRVESFITLVALAVALVLVMAWLRRRIGKPEGRAAGVSSSHGEDCAQLPRGKPDAPKTHVYGGFL